MSRQMKTLTLPIGAGESKTSIEYTFVQLDDTLAVSGKAADAKATGDRLDAVEADLTDVESALETKANIDGSYDSMTVGNAKQLTSNVGINDKAPYLFRTAGGANDIGDREEDTIVGGSLVWNQLVKNGNFESADGWVNQGFSEGISVENNKATLTGTTSTYLSFERTDTLVIAKDHKVLISAYISSTAGKVNFLPTGLTAGGQKAFTNLSGEMLLGVIISIPETETVKFNLRFNTSASNVSETITATVRDYCYFDLTQMFGSTIADYIYSLEQATAGAGVAWFRKLFPKSYYPYDAGTLKSVEGVSAHVMTGFNQWDEDYALGFWNSNGVWSSNTNGYLSNKTHIRVVPNTTYCITIGKATSFYIAYYDADKNFISRSTNAYTIGNRVFTTPANCHYICFSTYDTYGNTYNHDICINLSWDGERDGEYEPYVKYSYPLDDSLTLRGIPKLDANDNLYYDGDVYQADGTVTRKYGVVDLGSRTWTYIEPTTSIPYGTFYNTIYDKKNGQFNIICDGYSTQSGFSNDKSIQGNSGASTIYITDSSFNGDATALKTALNGVYLVYELATPTTETADPFQTPQVVDDWGTEEYVYSDGAFPIPVGHDTFYAANLKAKLEMAPDSPGDGDGDYIVRQTNGLNEYVKMVKELPSAPTTDGSYHLEVTVASGTPTLTWVADE